MSEHGFTIVEVLVAAVILILVAAAGTTLFAGGADSSVAAQRRSQMISIADAEIETIRSEVKTKGFAALAMTGAPLALNTTTIPNTAPTGIQIDPYGLATNLGSASSCGGSGWEYQISGNYDLTSGGTPTVPSTGASGVTSWQGCGAAYEPLQIIGAGFVSPQQTLTPSNDSAVTDTFVVDTFVTDTYVPCNAGGSVSCPTVTSSGTGSATVQTVACPGPGSFPTTISSNTVCADARRVTVAVILDDHGKATIGQASPVYLSTVFTNPTPTNEPTNSIGITLGLQLG